MRGKPKAHKPHGGGKPLTFKHNAKAPKKSAKVINTVGKPRKPIDWELFRKRIAKGHTVGRIAAEMGVSRDTLRSYQEYYDIGPKAKATAEMAVWDKIWSKGMKGNEKMLLHLALHVLGQGNRIDLNITQAQADSFSHDSSEIGRKLNQLTTEQLRQLAAMQETIQGADIDQPKLLDVSAQAG